MEFVFDPTITTSVILSALTVIFAWFRTRRKDVDERFDSGAKRMAAIEARVAMVEQTVATLPAKDDFHKIELSMAGMAGDMKAMAASQRSTNDLLRRTELIVDRQEKHLLDGAKS